MDTHRPPRRKHWSLIPLSLLCGCTLGGATDTDSDGSLPPQDCAPEDASIHPVALELCDGLDNDCDSLVDSSDASLSDGQWFYADQDGDGYGDPNAATWACSSTAPFSTQDSSDCNDQDPEAYPGALEVCDGDSEDCQGEEDHVDADQDGFSACSSDCDDQDSSTFPAAPERCDLRDNDCNGLTDDGEALACIDADADGYSSDQGDCNDANADTFPGALEQCNDGEDNGCSGQGASTCRRVGDFSLTLAEGVFLGPGEGARFGSSLEVGDVNADGQTDLIVGAPGLRLEGLQTGAVYVFLGPLLPNPGMPVSASMADVVLQHPSEEGSLGDAVVWVPPSRDASSALLLGSTRQAGNGLRAGTVYLVPWTGSGNHDPADVGTSFLGEASYDAAGAALATADINGDGQSDLLIGAPEAGSGPLEQAGITYVFTHRPVGTVSLAVADGTLVGPEGGAQTSSALAAGAFLAEMPDDVLIGAYHEGAGTALWGIQGPIAGRISLNDASFSVSVADPGGFMTWRSACLRDWHGPGLDGIAVGAPKDDTSGSNAGAVYLLTPPLRGRVELTKASTILWGDRAEAELGTSIGGSQDVDGDGTPDLLLGAPRESPVTASETAERGGAWLVYGPVLEHRAVGLAELHLSGIDAGEQSGTAVRLAGDLSGDGISDLVIGAPYADGQGVSSGRVYVVFGRGI